MISQIIFALLVMGVSVFAFRKYSAIRRNILLGKDEVATGTTAERFQNVLLVAFGQKKMFQAERMIPAFLHLVIYVSFVITQIELLEILVDGFAGTHRFFAEPLGGLYTFIISFIEILTLLTLIVTIAFFARRNLLPIQRFRKPELNGWPRRDANLILLFELMLITFIFTMNGAAQSAAELPGAEEFGYHAHNFAVSSWLGPIMFGWTNNVEVLHILERIGWWGHVLMVFGFLCYLPYSKHLHVILAFPGVYHAKLEVAGQMDNMPEIQTEVASMMNPETAFAAAPEGTTIPKFGASDIFDLSWRTVLQAYSCTECGRCTSVCPANVTGKELSPRKIVMSIRDRADEIGQNIDANKTEFIRADVKGETSQLSKDNYEDGRNLFSYISTEELRACTTCNACVQACPVMINPLETIVAMRRNLILESSSSPDSWNSMFTNIENNGAPWAFSPDDRDKWINE